MTQGASPAAEPAMDLSPFEAALLHHAARGERLDPEDGQTIDSSIGHQWGPDRTVRSQFLERLVTGTLVTVHRRGVQLRGGRILGNLDLSWARLHAPLALVECYFDGPIYAKRAEFRELLLSGSRVHSLDLEGAATQGDIRLDKGFSAIGGIRLLDADIGGQLKLTGAKLANASGDALNADGARVKGDAFFDGLSATGQVRLMDAEIGGQLGLRGANLDNRGGIALNIDGATINGSMVADAGFSAIGGVRLLDTDIGDQLICRCATLDNGSEIALFADRARIRGGANLDGLAATGEVRFMGADIGSEFICKRAKLENGGGRSLRADRARIRDSVHLEELSATGEVCWLGADIGSSLICSGATLINDGGHALSFDRATIGDSAYLDSGFSARGEVRLLGADIGGDLICRRAEIYNADRYAISADGATIRKGVFLDHKFSATGGVRFLSAQVNTFQWDDSRVDGVLDLQDATVHQLADHWTQPFKRDDGVRLSGFCYEAFPQYTDHSVGFRLNWVRSSPIYSPQPYTQLATVYRRTGHDDWARTVLIAREADRRKRVKLSRISKAKSLFLGATIAHGYKPGRAVLALVALWLITVGLLAGDGGREVMVATKLTPTTETPTASVAAERPTAISCPPRYPCFNPWVYSAETVIPLITLGQTENWQPAGGATRAWVWTATAFGWLFTTLALAGLTGIIRKD